MSAPRGEGLEDKSQAIDQYSEMLGETGAKDLGKFTIAIEGSVYGPIAVDAAHYWYSRWVDMQPGQAIGALSILSSLLVASEANYEANRYDARPPGWMASEEFQTVLAQHHDNVRAGKIELLPPSYRMVPREGVRQVLVANTVLENQVRVVRDLADFNYETYFSGDTMASAADLQHLSVEDLVEAEGFDKMPHLSRSNLWMRQKIANLITTAGRREKVSFLDLGSGTGATLSSAVSGLIDAKQKDSVLPNEVYFVGIDSNPKFQTPLNELAGSATESLQANGVNFGRDNFHIFHDDMVSRLDNWEPSSSKNDFTVVTANYCFHRLPDRSKARLLDNLSRLSSNVILLVGDLVQNASEVNLGYFNLAANGPLNAGNILLERTLTSKGYEFSSAEKVGYDFSRAHEESGLALAGVSPPLAEALQSDIANDGNIWLAWRGPAADALIRQTAN